MLRRIAGLTAALFLAAPALAGEMDAEFTGKTAPRGAAVAKLTPKAANTAQALHQDAKTDKAKASELDAESPAQARRGWGGGGHGWGHGGWGHGGWGPGRGWGGWGRGWGRGWGWGYASWYRPWGWGYGWGSPWYWGGPYFSLSLGYPYYAYYPYGYSIYGYPGYFF